MLFIHLKTLQSDVRPPKILLFNFDHIFCLWELFSIRKDKIGHIVIETEKLSTRLDERVRFSLILIHCYDANTDLKSRRLDLFFCICKEGRTQKNDSCQDSSHNES